MYYLAKGTLDVAFRAHSEYASLGELVPLRVESRANA